MIVLPEWLPDAVRGVVNGHFDLALYPIGDRLLTDKRMQKVWKAMIAAGLRCAKNDSEGFEKKLNGLPERYRRETWDTSTSPSGESDINWLRKMLAKGKVSRHELDRADALHRKSRRAAYLADNACASFFLAATIVFTLDNRTVTESKIKREVNRWQDGARLCREALNSHATVNPDHAEALAKTAVYFEEHAKFIETMSAKSPYFINRNARERAPGATKGRTGNENVRGQVRELAAVTEQIFGHFLYGTVATVVSVASGLSITPTSVENWCAQPISQ